MLARKTVESIFDSGWLVVIAVATIVGFGVFVHRAPHQTLRVDDRTYTLEVASTPAARAAGLSNRASMAADAGMLFVFDAASQQCMWMKDMRFSLDMIWLNHDKKVVDVQTDLSPQTYPKTFCPSQDSQFVIELHAGEADRVGIFAGEQLSW